jgi:aldehyde:ferredoxin oxidoreductase
MAFALPGGGCAYLKCHLWNSFMVSTKIIDYDAVLECCRLSQHNGLDIIAVARCIAFAIDLYEKGILTKQDTDGMHLQWSDKEVVFSLIEKVSQRDGIGDTLANGVYQAARQIGRGAEDFAHHIKKMEFAPPAVLMFMPYLALAQAISDKGDMSRNVSSTCVMWAGYSKEQRQELIKSPFWIYPKEYEKYYLAEFSHDGADYEPGCQFVAYDDETYSIIDMAGICSYWSVFLMNSPINSRALIADLVACATGLEISEADLTSIGRRALNLVRALNVRLGVSRKDDSLSKLIHKVPPSPSLKSLDPNKFNKWIDRYYEIKGWNSEGIPTKKTLQGLGLNYVWQDLEQRGILKD